MLRELERYREGLQAYIEATYHLSHPALVAARRELLQRPGTISQRPFLESTARYVADDSRRFRELDIPEPARDLLTGLAERTDPPLVFDPPYGHQADALERILGEDRRDLVVTTGTGSGKTETFLLPMLGRLYLEAKLRPGAFAQRGLRALVLYPMNALVNDQLARIRLLLGAPEVVEAFKAAHPGGRPPKFARYTGRSLYPGVRSKERDQRRLRPLTFYTDLLEAADGTGEQAEAAQVLVRALTERGKWPAKPDLARWYFSDDGRRRWLDASGEPQRAVELPDDSELITRHEVHGGVPDVLLTNYSMLEYTLLRPLERPIWRQARTYFAANPDETLLLVLDEAHLYRGASGTEVAMLLRRLRQRLGLTPDRVQVICTSASFSDRDAAAGFAASLVGKSKAGFEVPPGEKVAHSPAGPGDRDLCALLSGLDLTKLQSERLDERVREALPLLERGAGHLRATHLIAEGPAGTELTVRGLDSTLQVTEETITVGPSGSAAGVLEWAVPWSASATGPAPGRARAVLGGDEGEPLFEGTGELKLQADPLAAQLHAILEREPVVGRLVNLTSGARSPTDPERDAAGEGPAQDLQRLGERLFPGVCDEQTRRRATDVLAELCGSARPSPGSAPLLAARVHVFFRGLPGLWACLDDLCTERPETQEEGSPTGALYAQPRSRCGCGARVMELHSCRRCGLAVAVGYSPDPERPGYLWSEEASGFEAGQRPLRRVQLALEEPRPGARSALLAPRVGRLDSMSEEAREVWPAYDPGGDEPGVFGRCPRCGEEGRRISDHQTRGDQPFQEVVSTQLLEQPPRPESGTPLRGRKVLIFSDGRQAASRLSGNLKSASSRDAVRPLLLLGLRHLQRHLDGPVPLSHAYAAFLVGCSLRGVTPRPVQRAGEDAAGDLARVSELLAVEGWGREDLLEVSGALGQRTPEAILLSLFQTLSDPFTGLEALGLARARARVPRAAVAPLGALPAPGGPVTLDEQSRRTALLDLWVREALRAGMLKLPGTPTDWLDNTTGGRVRRNKGGFRGSLKAPLGARFFNANLTRSAGRPRPWLEWLQRHLGQDATSNGFFLRPEAVWLDLSGSVDWRRCERCTTIQPASPLLAGCVRCGCAELPRVSERQQSSEARVGYYRRLFDRAERDPRFAPHPFVAEEHSAQLNQAMEGEVFSRTEKYELRFQDVDLVEDDGRRPGPIDVLSCTTTMEVGIDIGSLTGVALRNVPPGRANYQQRAGRAGRRGSSLATVVTFAGADSHDQRFFSDPAGMVSGPVQDPTLNLHNVEIVRRHVFAMLLSRLQLSRIPDDAEGNNNLFMSLGSLRGFRQGGPDEFSFAGLQAWLREEATEVRRAVLELLPEGLSDHLDGDPVDALCGALLDALREAGAGPLQAPSAPPPPPAPAPVEEEMEGWDLDDDDDLEDFGDPEPEQAEPEDRGDTGSHPDEALDQSLLLDRLFAKAVLPRYAFPTDVVSFHVFDTLRSGPFDTRLQYSPQQGLTAALSQYAPGREVWVDGKRWYSMAIWDPSPRGRDRWQAYRSQKLYFECDRCGFAELTDPGEEHSVGGTKPCPACGAPAGMGPALRWIRPTGFAHPVDLEARLPDATRPPNTRSTRAKLSAPSLRMSEQVLRSTSEGGAAIAGWAGKEELLITNSGNPDPKRPGFLYCLRCGRAEPNGWEGGVLRGRGHHPRPSPPTRPGEPKTCDGRVVTNLSLGHVFTTDVALVRLTLAEGLRLDPASDTARIALRTIAEALALAAADPAILDLDPGELSAEWRAARTRLGRTGREFEVYLYDQVPGGAGYARAALQAADPGLLERALELLQHCPSGDGHQRGCDTSCYACLRSYQNRWLHKDLDRHLGAALLEHCMTGALPELAPDEVTARLELVRSHLEDDDHAVELTGDHLVVGGRGGHRVFVSHPLRPTVPAGGSERREGDVCLDQLLIDRALPAACLRAVEGAGEESQAVDPLAGLQLDPHGVPVFDIEDLCGGWAADPQPIAHAAAEGAPDGAFIVRLSADNLEDLKLGGTALRRGRWLLMVRTSGADALSRAALASRRTPTLLVRDSDAFKATARRWTFARAKRQRKPGSTDLIQFSNFSRRHLAIERLPVSRVTSVGYILKVMGG